MNQHNQPTEQSLKNADFLAWRVGRFQRSMKEREIRTILSTRDRVRHPTHH